MQALQHYINHIALVVDASGSMSHLSDKVVEVFDRELKNLRGRSKEWNQETRVSIYLFNYTPTCLVYDMDVMRFESLKGHYKARGNTALMDAVQKAVEDFKTTPELYGDHAYLVYVLTDGEENASRNITAASFATLLKKLPDNWTVACMVPNALGIAEAKRFGFSSESISVWDTTERGLEDTGRQFTSSIDNYMTLRSTGVRGTKSFFKVDTSGVTSAAVRKSLNGVDPSDYLLLNVRKDDVIKPFVESWTKLPYRLGQAYYELMKPEEIQGYKEICIQDRGNGAVFSGKAARTLLNLPAYALKVSPDNYSKWRIFVQSTSVNRKLVAGTLLLVMK